MGWTGFEKVFERVAGHGEDAAVLCSWMPAARVAAPGGVRLDVVGLDRAAADGLGGPSASGIEGALDDQADGLPGVLAFGLASEATDLADGALVCAGVFDGLGGLGARVLATLDGPLTEARIASRAAADALAAFVRDEGLSLRFAFADCADEQDVLAVAEELRRRLEQAFDVAFTQLHDRLGGTLLPTNAAVVLRVAACSGRHFALCLWAGDARCYLLEPSEGLHQLSRDDNGSDLDALADLRSGAPSPQTRRLGWDVTSAGGTRLNLSVVELGAPALLFACSDGVYEAGVRSPMHFELLLWRWVLEGVAPDADSPAPAFAADSATRGIVRANALVDRHWERCAQDDCSLAGVFSSTADAAWRARADTRMHDVYQRYVCAFPAPPGPGAPGEGRVRAGAAINALWDDYCPSYERYIANAKEER